ncbi:hypothetical protein M427DRAFT_39931 [Gonapodya prolifera JEL478]|uniref:Coiled-coil domain-containing protein 39 n=1 Tax=Gonapodya prolifera (strain JEL478) TaxID=1344416 RepID=A0A138ZWC2_GONPJ|nr:hypothetical protein M427DRAFT_39931 [Gonapodya prolifera JEL478]|eukprot:KXS08809.1 hypothetical protein M427DRAFT_39931 [Gonapodya prolifera JEL478]
MHVQRTSLLHKWDDAVRAIKERDEQIDRLRNEYAGVVGEVSAVQAKVDDRKRDYDRQEEHNGEVEKQIQGEERGVAKLRVSLATATTTVSTAQSHLQALRTSLSTTSSTLVHDRTALTQLRSLLSEKAARLENEKARRQQVEERKKALEQDLGGESERAKKVDEVARGVEARGRQVEREVKVAKETRECLVLRAWGVGLAVSSEGNLLTPPLASHVFSRQAHAGAAQVQGGGKEPRGRDQGRGSYDTELTGKDHKTLEDVAGRVGMVTGQARKIQEELRREKGGVEAVVQERGRLGDRVGELEVYNESAAQQLAFKTAETHSLLVDQNILRLHLSKLRSFLASRADQVFSLEHRKVSLVAAIEERAREVDVAREMLRVKIRQAEEERFKVAADVRDRASKLNLIRRRYEIIMGRLGGGSGEDGGGEVALNDGEERSQAYYIIKAAQEREELQKEGDDLDAGIRKTERELKALENTLRLMNERNDKYRENLYKADLSSKDLNQKTLLDHQYGAAMDRYKTLRRDIQHHSDQVRALEETLSKVSADETRKTQSLALLETKLAQIERDIAECEVKRERAVKSMERLSREIKRGRGWEKKEPMSEEVDVAVKLAKDFASTAINKIDEGCAEVDGLRERVWALFAEAGIQLPSKPGSKSSSVVPSRASSMPTSRAASTNASRSPSRVASVGGMARSGQSSGVVATRAVTIGGPAPAPTSRSSTPPPHGTPKPTKPSLPGRVSGSSTPVRSSTPNRSGTPQPKSPSRSGSVSSIPGRASPGKSTGSGAGAVINGMVVSGSGAARDKSGEESPKRSK